MQTKITNPGRKKRLEEFHDQDHPVMERYYDLLDQEISTVRMRTEMEGLIQEDPDFYDPYLILADMLKKQRRNREASVLLYTAYERALKRIVDKDGNFPKELPWGWLENRHLIRATSNWGTELWKQKRTEEALEIFRKLLRSNPNDNIGARQDILTIRLGLSHNYEKKFAAEGAPGYLDAFKLSKWFEENSKKFPDEFDWWFRAMEERR